MENTANREMQISRLCKAPIRLLWELWSNPEHLAKWWGPNGFTNTIHEMNFQEGGEWRMTMHGPDGTNYPNRSIFREILPFQKIVFEHFNPHFFTTVIFEEQGNQTMIHWTGVFDSAEMLDIIVKAHKADEGLKQNLDRLEQYLLNQPKA